MIAFLKEVPLVKPTCEHCGTNDPAAEIKAVTESAYWAELCECCRESLGAEA